MSGVGGEERGGGKETFLQGRLATSQLLPFWGSDFPLRASLHACFPSYIRHFIELGGKAPYVLGYVGFFFGAWCFYRK
jgi:hypothetical protein